jgi:hypothetical protein
LHLSQKVVLEVLVLTVGLQTGRIIVMSLNETWSWYLLIEVSNAGSW